MNRLTSLVSLLGVIIMAVSGERLGVRFGAPWEFAGFAFGMLCIAATPSLLMRKRIEALERKVSDLAEAQRP